MKRIPCHRYGGGLGKARVVSATLAETPFLMKWWIYCTYVCYKEWKKTFSRLKRNQPPEQWCLFSLKVIILIPTSLWTLISLKNFFRKRSHLQIFTFVLEEHVEPWDKTLLVAFMKNLKYVSKGGLVAIHRPYWPKLQWGRDRLQSSHGSRSLLVGAAQRFWKCALLFSVAAQRDTDTELKDWDPSCGMKGGISSNLIVHLLSATRCAAHVQGLYLLNFMESLWSTCNHT